MNGLQPEPIIYAEHAEDVLSHALACLEAGRRFALIASVEIQGGSAREAGSLAIVTEDGQMVGYLSNGCIDRDIMHHGLTALDTDVPKLIRYGAGSPFQDLRLPCGGALEVWIDPSPDARALRAAHSNLVERRPAMLTFDPPRSLAPTSYTFQYEPPVAVTLAGRGAIFRATAEVAKSAGFAISLWSPDEVDLAALAPLCPTKSVHLTAPQNAVDLSLDARSAFLTLFHDHDWEPALLLAALSTEAGFIGAMGSARTHAARSLRLARLGGATRDIARVHGPIGLVPSLRSAPLIAVSAIAQVTEQFGRNHQTRIDPVDASPYAMAV